MLFAATSVTSSCPDCMDLEEIFELILGETGAAHLLDPPGSRAALGTGLVIEMVMMVVGHDAAPRESGACRVDRGETLLSGRLPS